MMSHEIEFGSALCYTPKFVINGVKADSCHFGEQGDLSPETADDYCCGDMTFTPKAPEQEILIKYSIDELEYWTIANKLADGLSLARVVGAHNE